VFYFVNTIFIRSEILISMDTIPEGKIISIYFSVYISV
jgi:hypothetical protein